MNAVEQLYVGGTMTGTIEGRSMMTKKNNALDVQFGGSHYKDFPIQPFEYNQRNGLPFGEGCVVKYVSRHQHKNGIEDLRKAKHFLELIALVTYGEEL